MNTPVRKRFTIQMKQSGRWRRTVWAKDGGVFARAAKVALLRAQREFPLRKYRIQVVRGS
jgi:hypothetical protein